jgi:hypothetical protein
MRVSQQAPKKQLATGGMRNRGQSRRGPPGIDGNAVLLWTR